MMFLYLNFFFLQYFYENIAHTLFMMKIQNFLVNQVLYVKTLN